jgi:hypothetical protein
MIKDITYGHCLSLTFKDESHWNGLRKMSPRNL